MSRPRIKKFVCEMPKYEFFTAKESDNAEVINLTVEEYEVLRLIDNVDMSQEEAAVQMRVSRPTVQILYSKARKKMADFIVNGKVLNISGGEYAFCDDQDANCMHKNKCNKCLK